MSVEISALDGNVKKAAKAADEQDRMNGYAIKLGNKNKMLDAGEVNFFIREGAKLGCSKEELMEVATQVIDEDSDEMKDALLAYDYIVCNENKKERVKDLERQIQEKEKELKKLQKEQDKIYKPSTELRINPKAGRENIKELVIGGVLGSLFFGFMGHVLSQKCARSIVKHLSRIGGFVIGGLASAYTMNKCQQKEQGKEVWESGVEWGTFTVHKTEPVFIDEQIPPQTHNDSVDFNRANEFREERIVPLEQEINELRRELSKTKNSINEHV